MPRRAITTGLVNRRHPLNRGLLAWWHVLPHLAGGNTFFDLMGRNHGTFTAGMQSTNNGWRGTTHPGGFGSLAFSENGAGGTGYVACPQVTTALDNWTMAVWFRSTSVSNSFAIANGDDGGGGYSIGGQVAAKIDVLYNGVAHNFTATTIVSGTWYHVVASRRAGTLSVFVNGVKDAVTSVTAPVGPAPGVFAIGGGNTAGSYGYNVDDARVYGRGLDDNECVAIYNLSRRGNPGLLNRPRLTSYVTPPLGTITGNGYLIAQGGGKAGVGVIGSGSLIAQGLGTVGGTLVGSGSLIAQGGGTVTGGGAPPASIFLMTNFVGRLV